MFYNRDKERRVLEDAIASPHSELLIIYGRRGAGKELAAGAGVYARRQSCCLLPRHSANIAFAVGGAYIRSP